MWNGSLVGGASRRLVGFGLVIVVLALGGPVAAQPGGGPITDPGDLDTMGQWIGPWDMNALINPLRDSGGAQIRQWNEIAHAILLPDKSNTGRTRVLFICRRDQMADSTTPPWPLASAYVWDPNHPTDVTVVPMPADVHNIDNFSEDPFCGGHTFTPEGDVVFVGGTNAKLEFETPGGIPFGHAAVYVFVNDPTDNYSWVRVGEMGRARWYPTATALNDGTFIVDGHSFEPNPVAPPLAQETFDRGSITYSGALPTGIAWQTLTIDELANGVH